MQLYHLILSVMSSVPRFSSSFNIRTFQSLTKQRHMATVSNFLIHMTSHYQRYSQSRRTPCRRTERSLEVVLYGSSH